MRAASRTYLNPTSRCPRFKWAIPSHVRSAAEHASGSAVASSLSIALLTSSELTRSLWSRVSTSDSVRIASHISQSIEFAALLVPQKGQGNALFDLHAGSSTLNVL